MVLSVSLQEPGHRSKGGNDRSEKGLQLTGLAQREVIWMRNFLKRCTMKSRLDQKEFRQGGGGGWGGEVVDDLQES